MKLFKNIKLSHIIVMMMWLFSCSFQEPDNTSRLQGIEQPVIAETTLHFTYNPKGGSLEEQSNIKGIVYLFTNYKWEIADIKLTKGENVWNGEYTIPKDCAFLAFKFIANTDQGIISDTNDDNGFIYAPITATNQKIPGTDLAWGTFRSSNFNQQFGNYFKEFSISEEASEFWIKKEIKDNPSYFPLFIDTYIRLAKVRKPDDYISFGNKILLQFLNDFPRLDEPEYIKIKNLFAYTLQNKPVADSLENVILQKFPKGNEKRFLAFQKLRNINDNQEKIEALNAYLLSFPKDGSVPKEQYYIYNKVYQELFQLYFDSAEYEKIESLLPKMNFLSINDSYHHNVLKAFHFKKVDTKTLSKLSKVMIANMIAKKEDLSYMNGLFWSPNQSTENALQQLDEKLKTHIKILYAEKEYKEALRVLGEISKEEQYANSNTNELHMLILEMLNQPTFQLLEKSASYNALSALMIEKLQEQYLKKGHTESEFDSYLQKLKAGKTHGIVEKIKAEIVDIECPKLTVEDINSVPASISGAKDDILIIDFWATWCGPCKKAFPGMQMAVEKYKDDANVHFYFISTMESREGYQEQAETYIKGKGYTFKLLFDIKPSEGKTNNVTFSNFASIFKSSGIPRKVVVKNGRIRYTSEGSGANPVDLVDELTTVIEILKTE